MIKSKTKIYESLGLYKYEIDYLINNINELYHKKTVPKTKYGKPQKDDDDNMRFRDLQVPDPLLKLAQQRINDLLQNIPLLDNMYGSVKFKNNTLNALQHINGKYFFTIDLKDFFSRISNHQVFRMYMENDFSPTASNIFTKITTYKGSLPQGAPTSPTIANLVFKNTAVNLTAIAKRHNIIFTTYLDDLCFSSSVCFKTITSELLRLIKQNHFYLHSAKIHYRKNNCEVTGIFIANKKLHLIPEMLLEAKINPNVRAYCEYVYSYN